MIKNMFRVSTAMTLGVALVAAGASLPSQAKTDTVTACVKKKTGEVRVVKPKKKCKKGWKKISWNQQGNAGATGPNGPNLMVRDATGKVLGKSLGTISEGVTLLVVEIDGGAYTYLSNGKLYPIGGSPLYKSNTCTGTPYLGLGTTWASVFAGDANSLSRSVYRVTDPTFGSALAWKFTSSVESVAAVSVYAFDSKGVCKLSNAAYNGKLGVLESVPAPPDVPGPLTVS